MQSPDRPISRKEAMEQFRILERLIDRVLGNQRKERRDARYAAEEPEAAEAPEQSMERAMKTNMTAEGDKTALEWLEAVPVRTADA
eukprot:12019498-Heterocapsa_arctica.AAC.1